MGDAAALAETPDPGWGLGQRVPTQVELLQAWQRCQAVGQIAQLIRPQVQVRQAHQAAEVVADPIEFTLRARRFHEKVIETCGNETLIVIVGALEHLWSSREEIWQRYQRDEIREVEQTIRERGIRAHAETIEAIRAGETQEVYRIVSSHLEHSTYYAVEGEAGVRVV